MRRGRGQQKAVGAVPPRITPAKDVPKPLPPLPERGPWVATVVQTHRWRYELELGSGAMKWGWGGDGFANIASWGSRARAEAKARRLVDKLNRRDRLERERRGAATKVR